MSVELGYVAPAPLRRVQLARERVGFPALADEVVGGHAHFGSRRGRHAGRLVGIAQEGQHAVEEELALDEAFEAQREVLDDAAAEISSGRRAALVAQEGP